MSESEMVQRVAAALCCHKGECQMRSLAGTCCKSEHYASARDAIEEHVRALREDRWIISRYKTLPDGQVTPEIYDAALSPTGRGGNDG